MIVAFFVCVVEDKLSHDCDGTDAINGHLGVFWKCFGWQGKDAQDSRGEYGGQAEFLLGGAMQVPYHGHGQEQQRKIRDDVAEPMYVGHVGDNDGALGRRLEVEIDVPACSDGLAGENAEQQGDAGPDDEHGTYCPRCDAEFEVDTEDAIQEQEKR